MTHVWQKGNFAKESTCIAKFGDSSILRSCSNLLAPRSALPMLLALPFPLGRPLPAGGLHQQAQDSRANCVFQEGHYKDLTCACPDFQISDLVSCSLQCICRHGSHKLGRFGLKTKRESRVQKHFDISIMLLSFLASQIARCDMPKP